METKKVEYIVPPIEPLEHRIFCQIVSPSDKDRTLSSGIMIAGAKLKNERHDEMPFSTDDRFVVVSKADEVIKVNIGDILILSDNFLPVMKTIGREKYAIIHENDVLCRVDIGYQKKITEALRKRIIFDATFSKKFNDFITRKNKRTISYLIHLIKKRLI